MPSNIVNVLVRLTAIDTGVAARMSNITRSVRSVEGTLNRADGASKRFAGTLNQGLSQGIVQAERFRNAFMGTSAALFASMSTIGLMGFGVMGAALQTAINTQKEWSLITAAMGYSADKIDLVREKYTRAMLELVNKTGFSIGQIRDMWAQFKMLIKDVEFKEFTDSWAELIAGLSIMNFIPATAAANKLALALSGAPMGLRRLVPDIEKYVSFDAWRRMTIEQRKEVLKNVLTIKGYGEVARGYAKTMEGQLNILNSTFRTFLANIGMVIIKGIEPFVKFANKVGEWFRKLPKDIKTFIAQVFIAMSVFTLFIGTLGFVGMGIAQFLEFLMVIPGVNRVVGASISFLEAMFGGAARTAAETASGFTTYSAAANSAAGANTAMADAVTLSTAAMIRESAAAAETALAIEGLTAASIHAAEAQAALSAGAFMSTITPGTAATLTPAVAGAAYHGVAPGSAVTLASAAMGGTAATAAAAEAGEAVSRGFFGRILAGLRGFGGRFISGIRAIFLAPLTIIRGIPSFFASMFSVLGGGLSLLASGLTSPIGIIIILITSIIALITVTNKWGDALNSIKNFFIDVYKAVVTPLADALIPIMGLKDTSEGLRSSLEGAYTFIKRIAGFIGGGIVAGLRAVFGAIGYYIGLLMQAMDKIVAGKAGFQDFLLVISNPLSIFIWLLTRAELIINEVQKRWNAFVKSPEGKRLMAEYRAAFNELYKAWDEIVAIFTGRKGGENRRVREANTLAAIASFAASWVRTTAWVMQNLIIPAVRTIAWILTQLKPVLSFIKAAFDAIAWVVGRIVDMMEIMWTFFTKGPLAAMELATYKIAKGMGLGTQYMAAMNKHAEKTKNNMEAAHKAAAGLSAKTAKPVWTLPINASLGPQISKIMSDKSSAEAIMRARRLDRAITEYEAQRRFLLKEREAALARGDVAAAKKYETLAKSKYVQERNIILNSGAIQINAQNMNQGELENAMYNVFRRIGGGA